VRYTDESKERVRDSVDMIELVAARTDLRRAGANRYTGLCPFHEERTPSFGIDPVKKVYHCFGCGASGDPFTFVRETESTDFTGALELLADRYGVQLEPESEDPQAAERRRRRERLYAVLERATRYYERTLWESPEAGPARDYLAGRGLGREVLERFRVGYAPSAWDRLLTASQRAGFTTRELYDAGLVQRPAKGGRLYDRFRARITFPLCDARGRVLGFGARLLESRSGVPKYVNSPEGELYHKGRQLFGLHVARPAAAKAGEVVAAEGYTDVLAFHQAGLEQVVGIMGTAVTEDQVKALSGLVGADGRILLALDADAAGQDAMLRAATLAARPLHVVPLPEGEDPADLLAAGRDARALLAEAVPLAEFRVDRLLGAGDLGTAEGRDRVIGQLRPVLGSVPMGAAHDELVRRVASRLGLSEQLVASLATAPPAAADPLPRPSGGAPWPREPERRGSDGARRSFPGPGAGHDSRAGRRPGGARFGHGGGGESPRPAPGPPPDAVARDVLERRGRTERSFLALCIALPHQGRDALRKLSVDEHFTSPLTRNAAHHLLTHLAAPLMGLPGDDEELANLMAELTVRAGRDPAEPAMLEVELLQLEKDRLERQIAAGGLVGDLAAARREIKDRLDRAVDQVMARTSRPAD